MTYRVMVRCGARAEVTRLRRRSADQAAVIVADVRAGYPTWQVTSQPTGGEPR